MFNKPVYIKLTIFASLILIILLWFVLFFIPTNSYIYDANKKLKEMRHAIAKARKEKNSFVDSDRIERQLFASVKRQFIGKLFKVGSKEDKIRFYRKLYGHIQRYEKQDGIESLRISSNTERVMIQRPNPSGSMGKKVQDPIHRMLPGVKTETIVLDFKGALSNCLDFINHISWTDMMVSITTISVKESFKVLINVYYIDTRKPNEQ